jgi:phenylpropionate dioxygenase-like ring-hydroxylating dioxygenase large terminal subunit
MQMAWTAPASVLDADGRGIRRDLRRTGIDPDHWYPVARAQAIVPGRTLGVTFAGEPIVLVRTATGEVFALEDRCAHRQVPLHAGVVKGNCVQCCYHGWSFDRTGRCVAIPYLDRKDTPAWPRGVRAYPCREAYGLVFVFPGDPRAPGLASFPHVPTHANPRYRTRYLDRRVSCHYSFMHENLLDMNHQFLHRRFMGHIQTVFLDLRRGDGWVEADYTFRRAGGRQSLGERFMLGQRAVQPDVKDVSRRDIMTIRTEYPYQTLRFWTAQSTEPALDLWNVYVPVDREQRVNHTYGLMMIRKPPIPGLIHLLWPFMTWFTNGIFAEDRWVVEEEQKAFDRQGADANQEIFPVIRALRELLLVHGVSLAPEGQPPALECRDLAQVVGVAEPGQPHGNGHDGATKPIA